MSIAQSRLRVKAFVTKKIAEGVALLVLQKYKIKFWNELVQRFYEMFLLSGAGIRDSI